jgi:hypothetical protein
LVTFARRPAAETNLIVEPMGVCFSERGRRSIGDQQDDRQAIDRISKSRESCHPVKKPNRDLLNMCSNKTIKRY